MCRVAWENPSPTATFFIVLKYKSLYAEEKMEQAVFKDPVLTMTLSEARWTASVWIQTGLIRLMYVLL